MLTKFRLRTENGRNVAVVVSDASGTTNRIVLENALEAVEVAVAGSTNLMTATWEAYTNVVFVVGVTNIEVFKS